MTVNEKNKGNVSLSTDIFTWRQVCQSTGESKENYASRDRLVENMVGILSAHLPNKSPKYGRNTIIPWDTNSVARFWLCWARHIK